MNQKNVSIFPTYMLYVIIWLVGVKLDNNCQKNDELNDFFFPSLKDWIPGHQSSPPASEMGEEGKAKPGSLGFIMP